MTTEVKTIGFIGLGRMGSGIAGNILQKGFHLRVYNRTAEKAKPLVALGASLVSSPREAAEGADAVITCLLDDTSVFDTVHGEDGLLAGLKLEGVHIGTTTVSPGCATQLAALHQEHGSHYLAGPVVGRPDAADTGQLLTYVAGDRGAVEQCMPLLQAYTREVNYMGAEHRVANSVKLTINYFVISLVELMGQTYAFAEKSGVDLEFMNTLILMLLEHPAIKGYTQRIRTRNFDDAAFELKSGFKDIQLMLQASTDNQAPLNYGSLIRDKFLTAIAHGMEHKDWSAIYEITRWNAGLS